MKRELFRMISITVFCLLSFSASVQAEMTKHQKAPSLYKENIPKFEDYSAVKEFHGQPASVDLLSHPDARKFRTRLREAAREGPNFAGFYKLVSWGCGNECQISLIIDLITGKVYGLAEPRKNRLLESSRLLDFRLTSRLVIVDPPCPENYNPCVSFGRSGEPVRYYLMENSGLRLIHTIPCRLVNGHQTCGD